jgi:hypothetical protein
MAEPILLKQRYKIEKELRGSVFATTYLARDLSDETLCVIKCLHMNRADSWQTVELFQRQAKILSHLNHPGIPDFIDYFTEENENETNICLVQRYVEGKDLVRLISDGKHFTEREVIRVIHALADILSYLHSFSPPLVHRNIKPSNILMGEDGKPYLVDFGVVKGTLSHDSPVPAMTIEESYGYIPLEEFRGQANTTSDIYALGASMIYALSHVDPVQMGTMGSRLDFRRFVNISDEFAGILAKMVEPDWERRYQDVKALQADLKSLFQGRPPRKKKTRPRKRIRWIVAGGAIAAVIIWGVAVKTRPVNVPRRIEQAATRVAKTSHASEIATEKAVYAPDEPIVVDYADLPGNGQDWITIVEASAPDNTYGRWFYTNGSTTGRLEFGSHPVGTYEVRLYYDWPRGGYRVQRRCTFTVGPRTEAGEAGKETSRPTFALKVRLLHDGMPIQDYTSAAPNFTLFHKETRRKLSPEAVSTGEFYEFQGISKGRVGVSVEIDANPDNPKRHPGDLIKWGTVAELPGDEEGIDIDLTRIIRLTHPQDNQTTMKNTGAVDCKWPTYYDGPIEFVWESLGDDVTYYYTVGTVDCVNHVYHPESVTKGETSDTRIMLELPPSKENEKYAFHLKAKRQGRWIGRLYVHDEGGGNWNYGFRVRSASSGPVVRGQLMFDGGPVSSLTKVEPTFWFRNEERNVVETPHVEYRGSRFLIHGLPVGRMGMSVNLDLNPENKWSYPGDLRSWKTFQVKETENPELIVHMSKILRLVRPQDNGTVMEGWGAPCMEKIAFTSPVTLEWEPLGPDVHYDFHITRMDCLNHYNSKGTVAGKTIQETRITLDLPESEEDECYGFHISARKDGRKVGMLITHGGNGYGWDYRFRVIR